MLSLSVIVITRNEAKNIADCLASTSFADEWVVVDYASEDDTVDLARQAGAHVITTSDWPGFGPQKNRALDAAHGEWILSIDADERVTPALALHIKQAIARSGSPQSAHRPAAGDATAFQISRLTRFCGQWIHHCGWTPDYVVRLFRRDSARFSNDLVHERVLVTQKNIPKLEGLLLHDSYPTPSHYWRKLEQYSQAWAIQRHAAGQQASMLHAGLSAFVAFVRSYIFRLGFLDGALGFAVCVMQAQAAFGKYFALYCLNRNPIDLPKTPTHE